MHRLVARHPFLVNAVVAAGCTSLGDVITQKSTTLAPPDAGAGVRGAEFDWRRNLSYTVFGAAWSVPGRFFYIALAKYVPSTTLVGAVKGALVGELLMDIPVGLPIFTCATDLMRGRDLEFVQDHLKRDFRDTALSSFVVWFPATVINLRLVPLQYRVVWDSAFVVLWSSIYSFLTNRKPATNITEPAHDPK